MICQTISAPKWGEKNFLLILSVCFKIQTRAYICYPSKSLLPWQNLVRWYIILYTMWGTNDLSDDFRSKMVETDVLSHVFGLLQHQDSDIRQSSVEVITTLAKFGRLICHSVLWGTEDLSDNFRSKMAETDFIAHLVRLLQDPDSSLCQSSIKVITSLVKFGTLIHHIVLCEGQMICQTISALRLRKQMSLLVLLACFKIRTRMYVSHLSK